MCFIQNILYFLIITAIICFNFTIVYSLLKGKKKTGQTKPIDRQRNKDMLEILVNVHIPFLESSLQAKQKECDQLSNILYCRDDTIARKTTISLMKDDELTKLRTENGRLSDEVNELKDLLKKFKIERLVYFAV